MTAITSTVDYTAIKARQRDTWASGDYALIGTTLQIVGESLSEAVDVQAGERILDVAAGNGIASLAVARRGAEVTATDYVTSLLERAQARARSEGLIINTERADAEALPFTDDSFDVVLSTFGVMFAPNQERASTELVRAWRPHRFANWTPSGFTGQMLKTWAVTCRRRPELVHPSNGETRPACGSSSATHRIPRRKSPPWAAISCRDGVTVYAVLRQGDVVAQDCLSGRRVYPLVADGVPALPESYDRDASDQVRPREQARGARVTGTDGAVFVLPEPQPRARERVELLVGDHPRSR